MRPIPLICAVVCAATAILPGRAASPQTDRTDVAMRQELSQYGVTWTFDRPHKTGKFITGDWWVIGPVKVVSVTPAPGPTDVSDKLGTTPGRFGDTAFQDDGRMRNGSMVVLKASYTQGYDSRRRNYRDEDSVAFPYDLKVNHTLLSSISQTKRPNPNFLKGWFEKDGGVVRTVAALTCLEEAPPADAFRPPYIGTDRPIHRAKDLRRDLLPKLKPVEGAPNPDEIIRYFQRPWIDHMNGWLRVSVGENNPRYGREACRIVGFGGCMLLLDIDAAKKEQLLRNFVQVGIDLYGLSRCGKNWRGDGGHYAGRKFPIVFAGLMLGDEAMLNVPREVMFQEDQQTYYGRGFYGHHVLWQMVFHHQPTGPFEEKDPETWDNMNRRSYGYRLSTNGHSWLGFALAARWMKLIKAWNHDAMFDYCDRWMDPTELAIQSRGRRRRRGWTGKATDEWITRMWTTYRHKAPDQPAGTDNLMWVWEGRKGTWVPNPKPEAAFADPKTLKIAASAWEREWGGFPPEKTVDGDLDAKSSWRAGGHGQWIRYNLGAAKSIEGLEMAFMAGDSRKYTVGIEVSMDGEEWTEVFKGTNTGWTAQLEQYNFPPVKARYVRVVGYGNDNEKFAEWCNITEVKIRLKP